LIIRLSIFLIMLTSMCIWEVLKPKRDLRFNRKKRWPTNFVLMTINSLFIVVLVPFSTASVALFVNQNHWGLFNMVSLSYEWALIFSIIILDFIIYSQHLIFHNVPFLWRLHQIHHIDQDMDVTTGARFHPIEILISFLLKCVFVVLLGVSAMAILIFEIILNGLAMFNHSNIQMPKSIDKVLRILVVTPDMHRVHHSVISEELNTNYGFNLSVWDRIFGTYLAQPSQGHQNMTIGLRKFQNSQNTDLSTLLIIPFIKIKL